jgi:hypothetical protein
MLGRRELLGAVLGVTTVCASRVPGEARPVLRRSSIMHDSEKCQLSVCCCTARAGDGYCSDYCEQAASQGIPKDFCQCAHAYCDIPADPRSRREPLALPESIHVGLGQVTLECRTLEHLREQLRLLTEALQVRYEVLQAAIETAPRRPVVSEASAVGRAQSA